VIADGAEQQLLDEIRVCLVQSGRERRRCNSLLEEHHYLGKIRPVGEKTNEIPVAQERIPQMDLEGRLVSLDAMHTQDQTARQLVQEAGADYLLTVKKNRPTQHATIARLLQPANAGFFPSAKNATPGAESGPSGNPPSIVRARDGGTGLLSPRGAGRRGPA
jgi:hypothetical protein